MGRRFWMGVLGIGLCLSLAGCTHGTGISPQESAPVPGSIAPSQGSAQSPAGQLPAEESFPEGEGETEEEPDLTRLLEARCVRLQAGTTQGSGVIWGEQGEDLLILTAAHVVEGARKVQVIFSDGEQAEASRILPLEGADGAFLQVPCGSENRWAECQIPEGEKEAFDALVPGDALFVPELWQEKTELREGELLDAWIYMEDFQNYMMWASLPASPGMSGAGVFDGEGHLVGILCGGAGEQAAILPRPVPEGQLSPLLTQFPAAFPGPAPSAPAAPDSLRRWRASA